MSQSCVQGGSNGFSVLSHGSQLVAELGFFDVVASSVHNLFDFPKDVYARICFFQNCFYWELFLLWTDLCNGTIGRDPHFKFFG